MPTPMERITRLNQELDKFKFCVHQSKEIRYKISANNKKMYCWQCTYCGEHLRPEQKLWIAHNSIPDIETIKPFNDDIRQTRSELTTALKNQLHVAKNDQFWLEYPNYLSSPEWKLKRVKVLNRAGGVCEGCQVKQATQVHHLSYAHKYNEFLFELVAVCDSCHTRLHQRQVDE